MVSIKGEHTNTRKLALRMRSVWPRREGVGSREGNPSAVSILAQIGEAVVLGLLLMTFLLPASAVAAGGASPDPAPQTASGGVTASSPTPDPAPQAASTSQPAQSSPAGSSRQSVSTATSSPAHSVPAKTLASPRSGGSVTAGTSLTGSGPPQGNGTTSLGAATSRKHAASRVRRRHPRSVPSLNLSHPPLGLLLAHRLELGLANLSKGAPAVVRHDGILLLLSALALGVLVIASLALLRLVRLNAEWWEGRTS
jgi:hypothetical protein